MFSLNYLTAQSQLLLFQQSCIHLDHVIDSLYFFEDMSPILQNLSLVTNDKSFLQASEIIASHWLSAD